MTDRDRPGHSPGTEQVLPAPVRDGARAAEGAGRVEDLFRDHFDFVWSALRRLGVSTEGIDDAVQDVFLVVHRRQGGFEGRSSVKTWLYGIALRVARDHRRRVRRAGVPEPIPAGLSDSRPGPLDAAARAEAVRTLESILAGLDDEKREVLVLADLEQLSAPEISEIVGAKLNTVYSRLRAARLAFNEAVARLPKEGR